MVVIEFFLSLWDVIKIYIREYGATFNPKNVFSVQGHIRFEYIIIKRWEGKLLINSYSITLLNVTYKIFTKGLANEAITNHYGGN
jgi:hypothetical protein